MIEVPLNKGFVALLDDEDAWILEALPNWHVTGRDKNRYAISRGLRMHRLVVGLDLDNYWSGGTVDHVNGDGLDNRRCNLRICTTAENTWNRGASKNNRSGLRGVVRIRENYYRARIRVYGKTHDLGCFKTAEEAGSAYDAAARRLHGEFYRAPQGETTVLLE